MRRLLPFLILPLLAVVGCSDLADQVSDNVNAAASQALESGIRDQLRSAGIELDGTPDCSTDLSRDGLSLTGTADCSATTADGNGATATFDGTLSGSGCTGTITVVVDGRTVVESEEIPSCSIGL